MSATNPYETSGNYSSGSSLNLGFHITREDPSNKYEFYQKLDLSQTITDENGDQKFLSAVLIFIKKKNDNGNTLETNMADHNLTVNDSDLVRFSSEKFDYNTEEAVVILFHDNTYNIAYGAYFYALINSVYNEMKKNGLTYKRYYKTPDFKVLSIPKSNIPQLDNESIDDEDLPFIRPRTAGLTIIKRSLTS